MIVFPMSGLSSRFSKAGYLHNKYKLDLYGNSVFHHIVSQFKSSDIKDRFVFIHNGNDFDENFIVQTCKNIGLNTDEYFIVKLTGETRGQAETVFKGINTLEVKGSEQLIIYNIDSIRVDFNLPKEIDFLNVDGYLEVFKGEGTHWSFALPEDESLNEPFRKVTRVEEKNRISDYCSNGLYYFKSLDIFKEIYYKEVENFNENSELFVAPLYNTLIKDNKSVYMREIAMSDTIFCGTPSEYETILSSPIPNGIVPSEKYVAEKILSYTAEGISQKNYFKVMDMLAIVNNLEKSESIFKALNIFFSHYSSYSKIIDYAYLHYKGIGQTKAFVRVYKYLHSKILGFFRQTFNVQKDYQKSLNLSCVLIIMGNTDLILKYRGEFQEVLHNIRVTDHHSFFRVIRNNNINGLSFLENCFSKIENNESVSYLFMIFCAAYNLEDNSSYFSYIREKISGSYECESDDIARKLILKNYFLKKDESKIFHSKKSSVKVAVLITGQIRDCSYMADFFKSINMRGIEFDLYLSTWKETGSPPSHLSSLRGYDPSIRNFIRNRALKYGVSNKDFAVNYNLKRGFDVDSLSLTKLFGNLKWLNIDEEGVTTDSFNSNQERMFYQISKAYSQAKPGKYDVYIRTRPDLSLNLDLKTLESLILNCSKCEDLAYVKDYPLNNTYLPFVDDNFAICSPKAMSIYASLFDILKNDNITGIPLFNNGETIKQHSSLAYALLLSSIRIEFIKNISDWKLRDIGMISALEYTNYLKTLDKSNLNENFINSVISKLRTVK